MATISQHIYKIRTFIKQHTDDSIYSDEFLYSLLLDAKNILLEREIKKFNKDSEFHFQTICMPMEISQFHDCDCIPYELKCKVLKSKFKLPKMLTGRNKEILSVRTLDGLHEIPFIQSSTYLSHDKYSKTKKNKIKYTIENNHLIIFNNLDLKIVLVKGIFENPLDLSHITYCDENNVENTCYDATTEDFPVKSSLHFTIYQMVLEAMKIPLQLKQDDTNNMNPEK